MLDTRTTATWAGLILAILMSVIGLSVWMSSVNAKADVAQAMTTDHETRIRRLETVISEIKSQNEKLDDMKKLLETHMKEKGN
jgi:sensor c-di-GMP phosphodiesterase-like protein